MLGIRKASHPLARKIRQAKKPVKARKIVRHEKRRLFFINQVLADTPGLFQSLALFRRGDVSPTGLRVKIGLQDDGCCQVIQMPAAFAAGDTHRQAGSPRCLGAATFIPQHDR